MKTSLKTLKNKRKSSDAILNTLSCVVVILRLLRVSFVRLVLRTDYEIFGHLVYLHVGLEVEEYLCDLEVGALHAQAQAAPPCTMVYSQYSRNLLIFTTVKIRQRLLKSLQSD